MAWTAASCREPAGLLAADRRGGVSFGVVPELRHRCESEPGAGRILSASASHSGRPGFGALRRPLAWAGSSSAGPSAPDLALAAPPLAAPPLAGEVPEGTVGLRTRCRPWFAASTLALGADTRPITGPPAPSGGSVLTPRPATLAATTACSTSRNRSLQWVGSK